MIDEKLVETIWNSENNFNIFTLLISWIFLKTNYFTFLRVRYIITDYHAKTNRSVNFYCRR